MNEAFKDNIRINVNDIASGIYVIHLYSELNFLHKKVIFSEKK